MTILSQNIKNKTLIRTEIDYVEFIRTLSDPCNFKFSIRNYSSMIESLSKLFQEYCRQVIIDSLRKIDLKYRNSDLRKRDYYVKDNRSRTLVTPFGVITFKRTIYECKSDKKCFVYLDRKLGLPKWDKYDPCIKAMVCESYSNQNSMIKVGEIIGDHLFSQFSTVPHREHYRLSRQAVHNMLKSTLLFKHLPSSQKHTPKNSS